MQRHSHTAVSRLLRSALRCRSRAWGGWTAFRSISTTPSSMVSVPVQLKEHTSQTLDVDSDDDATLNLKEATIRESPEADDPHLVFTHAWKQLETKHGVEKLIFPKDIIWLAGAPGAGKGTMSSFIMKERGITAEPLETSSLLHSPEFKALKDQGRLIGDRDVVLAVLEALLDPKYKNGVIVDGFPRTKTQAECIVLLKDKMNELRAQHLHDPVFRAIFRRPIFHITVLYVEEAESMKRQLARGSKVAAHNKRVRETGVGALLDERSTDMSEELARERYRVFKDQVYAALQSIKDKIHFHFIPADGSPEAVARAIKSEFVYQSSLELGDDTFALVREIDSSEEITQAARQKMVQRLNSYAREHHDIMRMVVDLLKQDFMHILQRQALAGRAIIRSNSSLLENPVAINIVLDVLSERGYSVTLDVVRFQVPQYLEPHIPGSSVNQRIALKTDKTYVFTVEWRRPQIRRLE